jgi:hypothetical protein
MIRRTSDYMLYVILLVLLLERYGCDVIQVVREIVK